MNSEVTMYLEARLRVRMRDTLGIEVKRTPTSVALTLPLSSHATGMVLSHESWAQVVQESGKLLDLDGEGLKKALNKVCVSGRGRWESVQAEYSPRLNRTVERRFGL